MIRRLAVIGTAGRDKTKVMDVALWRAMCSDLRARVRADDVLVSGGAGWADHLAVHAFLQGWCPALRLYLPAPLVQVHGRWQFAGAGQSSGSAANWYHARFSAAVGVDSIAQIHQARERGAVVEAEPARAGFGGMFARNAKVASDCSAVLAYTFNHGDQPADGGTLNTWRQVRTDDRVHVDLGALARPREVAQSTPRPRSEWYR